MPCMQKAYITIYLIMQQKNNYLTEFVSATKPSPDWRIFLSVFFCPKPENIFLKQIYFIRASLDGQAFYIIE
jgi:hypothetical protein